eukprot:gnl/TRDRNA2_/TRDRNA2_158773_c0_seq1.p1 gnl/TRDRNA2_/TRDRNA2_158773_c0~~gnl/TRDRNA2_/TRDRNA2_158773_c0_seq1.p1  ORF type:complete len:176 (+),score=26.11 gnl/TRDRNA2_/TRDRNA2_158773_c0_seq1:129-656(+)
MSTMLNPYELVALQHLGWTGEVMKSYVRAAIFVGSILSGRHPHTDGMLYYSHAFNMYYQALVNLSIEGDRPVLVLDHADALGRMADAFQGKETRQLVEMQSYNVAELSQSLVEADLADVVWVLSDDDRILCKPAFAGLARHIKRGFLAEGGTDACRHILKEQPLPKKPVQSSWRW